MLSHDEYNLSLADPVARYMHQSGRRLYCTPEEILDMAGSNQQLVSWYFTSLSYLKERDFYRSWDEVPEPHDGMYAYIRKGRTLHGYKYHNDRWIDMGSLTDDMY